MATKQIACNLCGKSFVCNNGMWSTTCTCAKDQPELLLRAQKLRDAIGRAGFGVMETSGEWSLHCTTEAAKVAEQVENRLIAENIELTRRLRTCHKMACTVDDCVLDGGPEHAEAFES